MEAALCKSVLKPLREAIYQRLEKLHASDGSHKLLAQKQVSWMDGLTDEQRLSGDQEVARKSVHLFVHARSTRVIH